MVKKGLKVASVTHAVKGRELLIKNGFNAYIIRNPRPKKGEGCGYVIFINNYDIRCSELLIKAGIKVNGVFEGAVVNDLS